MRFLLTCIGVWLLFTGNAQPLVGNTDGQWLIYQGEEMITLPRTVHYVSNFDDKQLAVYAEYGRFGVLNSEGKVVASAQYREVEQLGHGIYRCLSDVGMLIADFSGELAEAFPCKGGHRLTSRWFLIETETERRLLNTGTGKQVDLLEGDTILMSGFDHLHVRKNGREMLFDQDGDSIALEKTHPAFFPHFLLIDAPGTHAVIFRSHRIDLPPDASNIRVLDQTLVCTSGGKTSLISCETGEIIFSAPFDDLRAFDTDHFMVQKDLKWGLIRKNGETVVPVKYTFIRNLGEFYSVGGDGGNGLLDKSGRELVPCAYSWVYPSDEFFHTTSVLGFQGLISRKTGRSVLDCVYDRVKVDQRTVRGWSNGRLRILKLDASHNTLSNLLLDNVITVKMYESGKSDRPVDERLFALGWFTEWVAKQDEHGFVQERALKWGLRGENDSLLMPARYRSPIYVPNADFSMLPRGVVQCTYFGNRIEQQNAYSLVDYHKGKVLFSEPVFSVDTMDLFSRSYVRFYGSKGQGILHADNKVEYVDYIDGSDDDFVRYCKSATNTRIPSDHLAVDAVGVPTMDQNDRAAMAASYFYLGKNYTYIRFPDAEWNFMDTAGHALFAEPFSFVKPFYRNTAVVKRNGWGVVTKDTVVVPTVFASVKRLPQLQDTVFLVKKKPEGIRLLDTLMHDIDRHITRCVKSADGIVLIERGREKKILAETYEYVSDESGMQKIISQRYVLSKIKKEYVLRDAQGHLLASGTARPEAVFHDRYMLVKSGSKYGLLDFFGDTVLAFQYNEIREEGPYLVAIDGLDNTLFSKDLTPIKNVKQASLLVDLATGNLAAVRAGKCIVFSPDGAVICRQKMEPSVFHNNWLVQTGNGGKVVHVTEGDRTPAQLIKNCQVLDDYGFLVEDYKGKSRLFTSDFKPVNDTLELRRAKYLGEGIVTGRYGKNVVLLSGERLSLLGSEVRVEGHFNSGYLLVTSTDSGACYLNTDFINAFRRLYKEAVPFRGGYAAVEEGDGWTIIDRKGNRKSLGSYEKITPVGNGMFLTDRQLLSGLYDSHGRELLPPVFQQINVLRPDLIQGIREGTIEYFDGTGRPVTLESGRPELTLH